MNHEKNISGLIHHLSRQLALSANQKWTDIGYPDIRTTHVSILLRLAEKETNHNILSKQLGISRQAISKLNNELIQAGYLKAIPNEYNKNSEILSLSKKGAQFLDDFKKANADLERAFIRILGKEEFSSFKSSLITLDHFFNSRDSH